MNWFLYDNGLRHEEVKFLDTEFLIHISESKVLGRRR